MLQLYRLPAPDEIRPSYRNTRFGWLHKAGVSGNVTLVGIATMNEYPVAVIQALATGQMEGLQFFTRKGTVGDGICRHQTVVADGPARVAAGVGRMVQDGDAQRFALGKAAPCSYIVGLLVD